MTRFIGIASGKGGTGKTTTSINLALALNNLGYDSTLIDANLATPHVSIHLGSEPEINLNHVLTGKNSISESIYKHSSGLKLIPASIKLEEFDEFAYKKLNNLLYNSDLGEIAFLDMSSGLNSDVLSLLPALTDMIIVANPDMPSVIEAKKTIKLAESNNVHVLGVVLNKMNKDSELSFAEVQKLIEKEIIGQIPEHKHIKQAQKMRQPVLATFPNSPASRAIKDIASKLSGKEYN